MSQRTSFLTALRRLDRFHVNNDSTSRMRTIFNPRLGPTYRIRFNCTRRILHELSRVFISLGLSRLTVLRGVPLIDITNITLTIGGDQQQIHWRGEFENARELGYALMNLELGKSNNVIREDLMQALRDNIIQYLLAAESDDNSGTSEILNNFWDLDDERAWGEISFDLPITSMNEQQFYNEAFSNHFDVTDLLNEREWAAAAVPVVTRALRGRGISRIDIEEIEGRLEIREGSSINIPLDEARDAQLRYYFDVINSILNTNLEL